MLPAAAPIGPTSLLGAMFQLAYVTNDIERAAALFHERYGTGAFHVMRDLPTDDGGMAIALAYAGDTNVELIDCSTGGPALYRDWIADAAGFVVRFHHVGMLIETQADWDAMRARFVDTATPIAMEGYAPAALDYLYADTVADLGHYLEYVRLYEGGLAMFGAVAGSPYARA